MSKTTKAPYMGRKKPTGAYNSTAKAHYLVDGADYGGSQRHLILQMLKYALHNNMNRVITGYGVEYGVDEDASPIYSVQKYWINDLVDEPEYHEQLFPFPMSYGVINASMMDETGDVV